MLVCMDVNTEIQVCACKPEQTEISVLSLSTVCFKDTKIYVVGAFYRFLLVCVFFITGENVMHLTAWLNFDNKTKGLLCHQKPQDGNTVLFFFAAYIYYYYFYHHNYYIAVHGTDL